MLLGAISRALGTSGPTAAAARQLHCDVLQKSVARFLRACLALLLFLVSFADGKEREEYVQLAWSTIMKILICLILCSVADVAKTLLAKLLSSHFHKRAHFDKMQDALNKVHTPTREGGARQGVGNGSVQLGMTP